MINNANAARDNANNAAAVANAARDDAIRTRNDAISGQNFCGIQKCAFLNLTIFGSLQRQFG